MFTTPGLKALLLATRQKGFRVFLVVMICKYKQSFTALL